MNQLKRKKLLKDILLCFLFSLKKESEKFAKRRKDLDAEKWSKVFMNPTEETLAF